MHTFLAILGIIALILLVIGILRWMFCDDVGFFEAIFFADILGDLFELIGDLFSSIGDD